MNSVAVLSVTVCLILLSACTPPKPPEHEVMPIQDTVAAPLVNDLNKARAVQDTINQSTDKIDAALQGASPDAADSK